ncbi:MAG TPA: copper resistance protein CopC, partial [Trueperaceae bacterium]
MTSKNLHLRTALLVSFLMALPAPALAHAELRAAEPEPNTVVTTPLQQISLNFSEPIELGFSLFKVYRLDPAATQDIDLSASGAWQRLAGLAGALMSQVLTAKDDQDDARVDTGPAQGQGRSTEVVLGLEPDLTPGFYVVMWRALSIDTHA